MEDGRERLKSNSYPGRGIVLGLDARGRFAVQVYWITGRSAGSKNRVLVIEGPDVRTQPFEEAGRTDDPNIYYRAIAAAGDRHVVSNGNHADHIIDALAAGQSFEDAVRGFSYETDAPNFTPRIAGLSDLSGPRPQLYLANAVRGATVDTLHSVYSLAELRPGTGYCLHTYAADGDPLPSFTQRPYELPLPGTPEDAATMVWELLAPDRRVALALKVIDLQTRRVTTLTVRNTLG
jgi:IMP cyclohydrolase